MPDNKVWEETHQRLTDHSSSPAGSPQVKRKTDDDDPAKDAKWNVQSLNTCVLPSGAVKRLHETSCPRGTTPPVFIQNPDTPFFDPYNHEAPRTNNLVHNQTTDYDGWTALHAAAQAKLAGSHDKLKKVDGDVEQVRFLISGWGHHVPAMVSFPHYSSTAIPVNSKEVQRGFTPLHVAVCAGHGAVVESLLKQKARVDARDCLGRTPIHWGCHTNQYESVSMMLAKQGGGTILGAITVHVVGSEYVLESESLSEEQKQSGRREPLQYFVEVKMCVCVCVCVCVCALMHCCSHLLQYFVEMKTYAYVLCVCVMRIHALLMQEYVLCVCFVCMST
jgi:hypothetical protein